MHWKISAYVNGGPRGGSSVRRPGSETPIDEQKVSYFVPTDNKLSQPLDPGGSFWGVCGILLFLLHRASEPYDNFSNTPLCGGYIYFVGLKSLLFCELGAHANFRTLQ